MSCYFVVTLFIVNRKKEIPTEDTSPYSKTGSETDETNYFAKAPILFNYKGKLADYLRSRSFNFR